MTINDQPDYLVELRDGFKHMFGDYFMTFQLRSDAAFSSNHTWYGSPTTYTLQVHLTLDIKDACLWQPDIPNWIDKLTVQEYKPREVSQQARTDNCINICAIYYISDLKDFTRQLREITWNRYEKLFVSSVDKVLTQED